MIFRHHFNHQPTRNGNKQKRAKARKSAHEAKMGAFLTLRDTGS